ncbi:DUF7546 family protein [Halorubrum vacuolatum]|uniref:Uncharacterized protein n=1 Tax=Halorubrum vacuolatum TaxID=63740 RepID=A0A238UX45_HALVU|nr:hypothetical protein [Halorubrum vacuolatum]SNR26307.1 hypothetical protein SAMN06264855_101470 [Halorubrum vacuolatum]
MATETETQRSRPARFTGLTGVAYRGLLGGTLAALAYATVLVAYLVTTPTEVLDPSRAAYPLIWFTVAAACLAAAFGTGGGTAGTTGRQGGSRRRLAWAVGVGYVGVLALISGTLSVGLTGVGVDAAAGLPGWGPIVLADGVVFSLAVVPFQFVGYVALGALLAKGITASAGSLFAGTLGLFSCAGCVFPVVAAGASALGVPLFADGVSIVVSTAAFGVTAVALVGLVVHGERRSPSCSR